MGQPSRDQSSILMDLFPSTAQLTSILVSKKLFPEAIPTNTTIQDLTPTELEFVNKCDRRREHLRGLGDREKDVRKLKETYSWETFLREFRLYISKNWETIVGSQGRTRKPVRKPHLATEVNGKPAKAPWISSLPTGYPTTNRPIGEVYENARMSLSLEEVAHTAVNLTGNQSTTIPPMAPPRKLTIHEPRRPISRVSQIRQPWTEEEGIPLPLTPS
jgi:hypothetical protein